MQEVREKSHGFLNVTNVLSGCNRANLSSFGDHLCGQPVIEGWVPGVLRFQVGATSVYGGFDAI